MQRFLEQTLCMHERLGPSATSHVFSSLPYTRLDGVIAAL